VRHPPEASRRLGGEERIADFLDVVVHDLAQGVALVVATWEILPHDPGLVLEKRESEGLATLVPHYQALALQGDESTERGHRVARAVTSAEEPLLPKGKVRTSARAASALVGSKLHLQGASESADEAHTFADIEAIFACQRGEAIVRKLLVVDDPNRPLVAVAHNLDLEGGGRVAVWARRVASALQEQEVGMTLEAKLVTVDRGCHIPALCVGRRRARRADRTKSDNRAPSQVRSSAPS